MFGERGNYCLAIVKVKEDYENIKASLEDISREMEVSRDGLEVDGVLFKIKCYLGGDYKFLLVVCGTGAATSDYACVWCLCPKKERGDLDKTWSMNDSSHGRTVAKIVDWTKSKNCKHSPIFKFIPLDQVVVDSLNLFLRIADVLITC